MTRKPSNKGRKSSAPVQSHTPARAPAPSPSPSPAPALAPTPSQAPTPAPALAPAPTQAPSPTPTQAPSPTPTQAPSPAPAQAPTPAPTPTPTPAPSPAQAPGLLAHLPTLVLALTALLALLTPVPDGHRYAPLFEVGRLLVAIGALGAGAVIAFHRYRPFAFATPALLSLLTALGLGLAALVARHGHDFRLFSSAHPATLGIPSELFLVALAVGLVLTSRPAPSRTAHVLLALGLGLTTASLLAPDAVLAAPMSAFSDAFHRGPLQAVLAFTTLATLLVALLVVISRLGVRLPARLAAHLPTASRAAPLALLIVALGPALTSTTPLLALVVLAALAALHFGVTALASDTTLPALTLRLERLAYGKALFGIVGLWILLKSHALIASNTDENIYFYMAKILGDGVWPYADYFFAHPPLHVVLPGLLFSVFGFSLTFAKVLPLAFCLIGGLALAATTRRLYSPIAALVALVLYLFASEVLKASSNMTGVNMTTMFLLLGLWQALIPRPFTSGMLLALAPATGFYAMAPVLAILALSLFRRPDPAQLPAQLQPTSHFAPLRRMLARLRDLRLAQLAGFVLVLGSINLVFWAIGGDTFLEGVYAYHQQKTFQEADMVEIFGGDPGFPLSIFHNVGVMLGGRSFLQEVFYHPHLWLAGLLVPLVVLASWLAAPDRRRRILDVLRPSRLFTTGPDGQALFIWLTSLALFVQFAMFRELYSFYFALIYPFLAMGAAYVVWRAISLLVPPAATAASTLTAAPPSPTASALHHGPAWVVATSALALAALVALQSHGALSLSLRHVFQDEAETTGARNEYDWTDAPVLTGLSPVIKNLFWEDFRLKGDVESGARHFLWTKKRGFSRLEEVAAHIQKNSLPDETIAGSSTLAPLVALMADRRIAANEIDTNNKRFRTGILAERDYWNAACQDRLRFIISAPRSYFTPEKMRSLPTVSRQFGPPTAFEDHTILYRSPFQIALFSRLHSTPCTWIE